MPIVIIAGEQDKLIDIDSESARLHSDVHHSTFHRLVENGHMIHQTATDQVMAAIDEVGSASRTLAAAE
jgi:pimeloyl-ACP methyl ester carboxylesterase